MREGALALGAAGSAPSSGDLIPKHAHASEAAGQRRPAAWGAGQEARMVAGVPRAGPDGRESPGASRDGRGESGRGPGWSGTPGAGRPGELRAAGGRGRRWRLDRVDWLAGRVSFLRGRRFLPQTTVHRGHETPPVTRTLALSLDSGPSGQTVWPNAHEPTADHQDCTSLRNGVDRSILCCGCCR